MVHGCQYQCFRRRRYIVIDVVLYYSTRTIVIVIIGFVGERCVSSFASALLEEEPRPVRHRQNSETQTDAF